MLTQFKYFVNKNKSDIFFIISIILVALISFGAGYLLAPKTAQQSIIFQEAAGSLIQSLDQGQGTKDTQAQPAQQGKFVGSSKSNKYHWPDCPFAQKIAVQNQVWFNSEAEAQTAGYKLCSQCEKNMK